ncbi:MAG TPA: hypothetical protein VKL22_06890 [Actinomycetota bacterium]|nr:hypothetical protein [Actinomycetota bacterium]
MNPTLQDVACQEDKELDVILEGNGGSGSWHRAESRAACGAAKPGEF